MIGDKESLKGLKDVTRKGIDMLDFLFIEIYKADLLSFINFTLFRKLEHCYLKYKKYLALSLKLSFFN